MPRLVNTLTDELISTAYKVMYSSMMAIPTLREIGELEFTSKAADALGRNEQLLMAVRNPYARLSSFFADKLRHNLEREEGSWQFSQLMFFPLVGVTVNDSFAAIKQALQSISFEAFIDYLPHVWRNGHLRPQAELLRAGQLDLALHTCYFPIETDGSKFWSHLGISEPPQMNTTFSRFDSLTLSRARLDSINDIYADDFAAFGYEML